MKNFSTVTVTWILAQLLHPLVWACLSGEVSLDDAFAIVVISFLFSLPSYLLCLLAYPMIGKGNSGPLMQTFSWLLLSQVCILAGSFLASLFIGFGFLFPELTYPAHIAAAVAVVLLAPFLFRKKNEGYIPDDFLTGTAENSQSE